MSESENIENRHENDVTGEITPGVTRSEAPSTTVPSDLTTSKEAGELDEATRNIRTTQSDGLPARRGPTGPRSVVGKNRSSKNALKSGIFSRATLLKGESRADYESLREALRKSKRPEDEFEELLIDMMASNLWRQRRAIIAEGAEIRINSLERIDQQPPFEIISILDSDKLISKIDNPDALELCFEMLAQLRLGIETNGFDEKEDGFLLTRIYGDPEEPHLQLTLQDKYSKCISTSRATEEERALNTYAPPEVCKKIMLSEIDAEIARLKQNRLDAEKRESIEFEKRKLEILRQRVPDSPGQEQLLGYVTKLERAFDRMLAQYERAQRIRKGQPLPPQLDVKIS